LSGFEQNEKKISCDFHFFFKKKLLSGRLAGVIPRPQQRKPTRKCGSYTLHGGMEKKIKATIRRFFIKNEFCGVKRGMIVTSVMT